MIKDRSKNEKVSKEVQRTPSATLTDEASDESNEDFIS